MAELGTYYITIMPDMSQFTGEVKAALGTAGTTGGKSFGSKFSDVLKGSAIGTALGGLAQKAGRSIMDGMDVGIKRLDTLKNYPKVMEALGYSTEDADRSISTIMQHLDGLPSSTQDLVTLTQAISDSTGDLDLATAAALGFNDMLLANGASASEVATAQGVLNRVLGKGSATAAQWQSLTSVMPAQLGMVAKHMLGTSASTEDLHAALEDGTVSWNDFLGAIAELDQSGYIDENGRKIASFTEQARANSHGIGTAIENVKNRIGAGWASIFDAVGQENISGAIDKMSYGIKSAMQRVGDAITYVKEKVGQTNIGENLAKIGKAVGDAFGSMAEKIGSKLPGIADTVVDFIDKGLQWVVDHGDLVASLLGAIGGAMAFKGALGAVSTITGVANGLGALGKALPLVSKFGDLPSAFALASEAGGPLSGMFSGLGSVIGFVAANPLVAVGAALAAVAGGLVYFFTQTEKGREIWGKFKKGLADFGKNVAKDVKGGFDKIKQNIADNKVQWEKFKSNLAKWNENIRANVQAKWSAIKTSIKNQAKEGMNSAIKQWQDSKAKVAEWNEKIRADVQSKWSAIKTNVSTAAKGVQESVSKTWDNVKSTASTKWNAIKTTINTAWTNIKSATTSKVNEIKTVISTGWDNVKSTASTKWNAIKTTIATAWTNIKSNTSTKVNEIKTTLSTAWDSAKSTAASKWDSIKSTITSKLSDAKSSATTKANEIKTTLSTAWDSAKSTAASKWDSIKSTISSKMGDAKSAVSTKLGEMRSAITSFAPKFSAIAAPVIGSISGALQSIRDKVTSFRPTFPTISWPRPSMPHIPVPHFSISWTDILGGVVKVPSVSFNGWWAKGGVFDTASIIGIGEAGREAALPLNRRTYGEIARGIAREGAGGGVTITGNTFIVRKESDIKSIATELNRQVRRERWAMA